MMPKWIAVGSRRCPLASHAHPYIPVLPSFLLVGGAKGVPRTVLVSLLCVGSAQSRAKALAISQLRPSRNPILAVGNPLQQRLRLRLGVPDTDNTTPARIVLAGSLSNAHRR